MFQLRKVVVRGRNVPDAGLTFVGGANILSGLSDTGKSYLVHCLDYIFGAETLNKRFRESEAYSQLLVEFANDEGEALTLQRPLAGGNLLAQHCTIEKWGSVQAPAEIIVPSRKGTSRAKDVTSVLFPFADLPEAQLRKNVHGELRRLTFRQWLPSMLVDEVAVIDERSPVRGAPGFDATINERAFAFSLSGRDDSEVVSAERNDVIRARLNAKLTVIDSLLEPIDFRITRQAEESGDAVERVEAAISQVSAVIEGNAAAHIALEAEREVALGQVRKADSQVMALDELLGRYELLFSRYTSDLERLDFIAEGAYYFGELQAVSCPLCEQPMDAHRHPEADHADVQAAARAEAAKILALRSDLTATISSVEARRRFQVEAHDRAQGEIARIDREAQALLTPEVTEADGRLSALIERRLALEAQRNDRDQAASLRAMRATIEQEAQRPRATVQKWEALPAQALELFCQEIEAVLKEWDWPGRGKVSFEQTTFDINVDGQPRQSHGKGVRGVLYAAFVMALLNYCRKRGLPHPGLVVIDSPLTAYSKKKGLASGEAAGMALDAGVEAKFWDALTRIGPEVQVIVVENKAPPRSVASKVGYTWFAGEFAEEGERMGFFPPLV